MRRDAPFESNETTLSFVECVMGQPYSTISFSFSDRATVDDVMDLMSSIHVHLVRPNFICVAVADGAASKIVNPFDFDLRDANSHVNLFSDEVASSNPEYTRLKTDAAGIAVWGREKEAVRQTWTSLMTVAEQRKTWTWVKFWGPTKLTIPIAGEMRELWALREFHKTSKTWNPIFEVTIHLDPNDVHPIFLNVKVTSHAFSPVTSAWDPQAEDWQEKAPFEQQQAETSTESLSLAFTETIKVCELANWEFENPSRVNLLGHLPELLKQHLEMEPISCD